MVLRPHIGGSKHLGTTSNDLPHEPAASSMHERRTLSNRLWGKATVSGS